MKHSLLCEMINSSEESSLEVWSSHTSIGLSNCDAISTGFDKQIVRRNGSMLANPINADP